MEDYMTRTLPAPPRMRPQPSSTSSITNPSNFKPNPPSLNPPSYYSTYHPASTHHHHSHYPPRPRPQFQATASTSPVKFYRQTHNNYYNSYYEENGTSTMTSNMTSSMVTMRRPPNSVASEFGGCSVNASSSSTSSSRRNAVYIKEVTPEAAAASASKSKPPLPNDQVPKPPKPPPRSRPKSWTSTLFNAMRNNHRSVTFQCVEEENQRFLASTASEAVIKNEVIIATDPTMPLAAASSTEGQKFYSLPRPPAASGLHQGCKLGPTRSRTPSPFRSMIKGLVKGVFDASENLLNSKFPNSRYLLLWTPKSDI